MKTLSMTEAASHLGIGKTAFWQMRKDYPLKTIPLYRREVVDVDVLEEWFRSQARAKAARKRKNGSAVRR